MTSTLHKDQYTRLIIPRAVLLIMRNISDKVVEKIKMDVLYSRTFFGNHTVYEIM